MSNEMHDLEFAKNIVWKLNDLMMTRLPGYRIATNGAKVSIEKANGKFCDAGLDAVSEFHLAFEIQQPPEPFLPPCDPVTQKRLEMLVGIMEMLGHSLKEAAAECQGHPALIRLQLIQEENAELGRALVNNDVVEAFDALVDLSYVVDGSYLAFGLGHYKLAGISEVHRSNMTKLGADGKPIVVGGRVTKGPNYSKPNLKEVLGYE